MVTSARPGRRGVRGLLASLRARGAAGAESARVVNSLDLDFQEHRRRVRATRAVRRAEAATSFGEGGALFKCAGIAVSRVWPDGQGGRLDLATAGSVHLIGTGGHLPFAYLLIEIEIDIIE